jgi:hypothetical protein
MINAKEMKKEKVSINNLPKVKIKIYLIFLKILFQNLNLIKVGF